MAYVSGKACHLCTVWDNDWLQGQTLMFEAIDLRIGRIISAIPLAEARKPAYRLEVDCGPNIGVKASSAQLTFGYPDPSLLLNRLVVAVVNLPPRKVAGFKSEVLVTGFYANERAVFILKPAAEVQVGSKVGLCLQNKVVSSFEPLSLSISIEQFVKCKMILGRVVNSDAEHCVVDCGNEFGRIECVGRLPLETIVTIVQKEDGKGAIMAVPDVEGRPVHLTCDGKVPMGTLLA